MMANERMSLNEAISADVAYAKFYSDKIDKTLYAELMQGSENMTPYHKFMLDKYLSNSIDDTTVKLAGKVWANASLEGRQYLIFAIKNDEENVEENIPRFLGSFSKMKTHTENSYYSRGLEVLYEDENIKVTCTKSYTSSCREYGASHWCTASDIMGEWNGFQMFIEHTEHGDFLIQFIDKRDIEGDSYQAQFRVWGKNNIILQNLFDWNDKDLNGNTDYLEGLFSSCGLNYDDFMAKYVIPNAERLVEETKENIEDEIEYYDRRERVLEKNMLVKINSTMSSERTINKLIECVKKLIANNQDFTWDSCNFDGKHFDVSIEEKSPNYLVECSYCGTANEYDYVYRKFEQYLIDSRWIKARYLNLLLDENFNLITTIHGALVEVINNVALFNDVTCTGVQWGETVSLLVDMRNGKTICRCDGCDIKRRDDWLFFKKDGVLTSVNIQNCSVVNEYN